MENYKIVIADDHPLIRQGLRKVLEGAEGIAVAGEADDGVELMEMLTRSLPDLVVLDISMPEMRGIDALREIKSQYPDVKVLILTMHKEYLSQALAAGADGYLLKEEADRELLRAIQSIQKGKMYMSPRLAGEHRERRARSAETLTPREKEILKLVAEGKSNREIADILLISVRTVESHRAFLIRKLNLKKTADLVRYAMEKGFI
jgi:DNA-binding NarL/FixJ family response regulator